MAEVKLLSIKMKPENSYFFGNEGATLDSNSNKVTTTQEEQAISKKSRKQAEKKEKKQKKKDSQKREKELRNSAKKSRKEKQEVISAGIAKDQEQVNGDVAGPHFKNAVFEEKTEHNEDTNHEQDVSEGNVTLEASAETSSAASPPSELIKNDPSTAVMNVEEVITVEGAEQSEEAPPESQWKLKNNPEISEMGQGQHVEIEISEITESENMPENTNGVLGPGNETGDGNSPILVATVHEVESGADLDDFFAENFGEPGEETEEKRLKSVRFQEPVPDADGDSETNDADNEEENGKEEDEEEREEQQDENTEESEVSRAREPGEETINKEVRSNAESCVQVNLENIFNESHEDKDPTTSEPAENNVQNNAAEIKDGTSDGKHSQMVVKHRIKFEDVALDSEQEEEHEEAKKKKEKRKKSKLVRCCFP